jgi:hypothetical protein
MQVTDCKRILNQHLTTNPLTCESQISHRVLTIHENSLGDRDVRPAISFTLSSVADTSANSESAATCRCITITLGLPAAVSETVQRDRWSWDARQLGV